MASKYKAKYKVFERLCKKNKTTPYRVGKDLDISRSTFTEWKHDNYAPKIDKVLLIADYFDVPVTEFYERRG